tara:strand:- start:900 stop:1052 length:153 start_codon:yes stop_codon:yes gene_type:complete
MSWRKANQRRTKMNQKYDEIICISCGEVMFKLQECHLRCPNCGGEIDCSD